MTRPAPTTPPRDKDRRKELGKAFLNVFTLLFSGIITTDFFTKLGAVLKIAVASLIGAVLVFGWLLIPPEDKDASP